MMSEVTTVLIIRIEEFSLTRKSNHDPGGNHDGIQNDHCLKMLALLHIE